MCKEDFEQARGKAKQENENRLLLWRTEKANLSGTSFDRLTGERLGYC